MKEQSMPALTLQFPTGPVTHEYTEDEAGYSSMRTDAHNHFRPKSVRDLPADDLKGLEMLDVNVPQVPFEMYSAVGDLLASFENLGFAMEKGGYNNHVKVFAKPSNSELTKLLTTAQTEFDVLGKEYDDLIGTDSSSGLEKVPYYTVDSMIKYANLLGVPLPWEIVLPYEVLPDDPSVPITYPCPDQAYGAHLSTCTVDEPAAGTQEAF